ncbi:hypothetical protein V493_05175 [Pseudogymnoascus sp. VKM F-4281 (FW-2241)]|nr:hypothetical protein V493_05175 [Pseudogymnoascus sp. VKM F-4281 (FW-2241)]
MTTGANQVVFRTAARAVNDDNHLRVYTQDISGVSNNNTLQEEAHDANTGWYDGSLTGNNFAVAPYTRLGATYLAGTNSQSIRVYAQLSDNSIQEYGWETSANKWHEFNNLGQALPGTAIAATSFTIPNQEIRFSVSNALPRTALAVTVTESGSIHVYYIGSEDRILEQVHDANSGWYAGAFAQSCIPSSQATAINWGTGNGLNLRVYLQEGVDVSGVSEFVWNNGYWSLGAKAIPTCLRLQWAKPSSTIVVEQGIWEVNVSYT